MNNGKFEDNSPFSPTKSSNLPQLTSDFNAMIYIIIWTSSGFFFLDFVIPYVSAQILYISGTQLGFLYSIIVIGNMLAAPIVGILSDKISKTRLVLIGAFGRAISYAIIYVGIIIKSLTIFGIGFFFLGLMVIFFWIPINHLVAQKSCPHNRSYAYGIRDSALGKGMFIGGIIGATIFLLGIEINASIAFIYSPLLLFCGANFIGGILFLHKVDEYKTYDLEYSNINILKDSLSQKENDTSTGKLHSSLVKSRAFIVTTIIFLFTVFCASINERMARPFIQFYIAEFITSDPALIMILYIPMGILTPMIAPILGRFADKIKPRLGLTITSAFGALVTWILINTTNIFIFAALLLLDGSLATTAVLIFENYISRLSKQHRGKVLGISQIVVNLGEIIGPLIGGLLYDYQTHKMPWLISIYVELSLIPLLIISMTLLYQYLEEK